MVPDLWRRTSKVGNKRLLQNSMSVIFQQCRNQVASKSAGSLSYAFNYLVEQLIDSFESCTVFVA